LPVRILINKVNAEWRGSVLLFFKRSFLSAHKNLFDWRIKEEKPKKLVCLY